MAEVVMSIEEFDKQRKGLRQAERICRYNHLDDRNIGLMQEWLNGGMSKEEIIDRFYPITEKQLDIALQKATDEIIFVEVSKKAIAEWLGAEASLCEFEFVE